MNIAPPQVQRDLGFSPTALSCVINAYTLVQVVIGLDPLEVGFAFLPLALPMVIAPSALAPCMVERFGAKVAMTCGLGLIAASMIWPAQLDASTPSASRSW